MGVAYVMGFRQNQKTRVEVRSLTILDPDRGRPELATPRAADSCQRQKNLELKGCELKHGEPKNFVQKNRRG